ncbi:hypothetical protein [Massilia sp. CCM 8734]|uniref:hypothetical protein n=1 Tax=Massilia sp. CCM 8734 TaxID=2609283 RepID=UPI00141DA086|nr:hypothetical protein [Massilia sp. CCM 8734]NHZ96839.1 hypothetical protein [Massilia sp. CCM 8734]
MERLSVIVLVMVLSGCASVPKITYHKLETREGYALVKDKITDSYYLNTTVITITPQETKSSEKSTPLLVYSIAAEPVEARDFKVGIEPKNSFRTTTKVNIVKAENTDRVSSVGSETTENLKDFISKGGGLLVQLMGIAGLSPDEKSPASCKKFITSPVTIDVSRFLADKRKIIPYNFEENNMETSCITLEIGKPPFDAVETEKYPWNIETSNFYYSACRDLKLTITYPDKRVLVKSFRIADPFLIQSVQFPYKGSISMHSQCGVSVKTDGMANPNYGLEVANEIAKQIGEVGKAK